MVVSGVEELARIVGLGLVGSILLVYLRPRLPEYRAVLSIGFAVLILSYMIQPLQRLIGILGQLRLDLGLNNLYLGVVLKATGIAYLAALGSQLSKDAGEETMAMTIELAGKIMILVISIPVIMAIVNSMLALLP